MNANPILKTANSLRIYMGKAIGRLCIDLMYKRRNQPILNPK